MWMNHQLKKDYVILASNMEQVLQSVMCHALLMHYVETHWAPIGHLLAQIGELGSCGLAPPTGHCECHIVDESDVTQGETGSNSSTSPPSLQSVSSVEQIYILYIHCTLPYLGRNLSLKSDGDGGERTRSDIILGRLRTGIYTNMMVRTDHVWFCLVDRKDQAAHLYRADYTSWYRNTGSAVSWVWLWVGHIKFQHPPPPLTASTTPPPSYQQCQSRHQSWQQKISPTASLSSQENLPPHQNCTPQSQETHNCLKELSKEKSLILALQEFRYRVLRDGL